MVLITVRLRMDTVDNAITKPVHRLEVFTGAGRRRTWSDEDKARIVAEIAVSGESVSAVARRHRMSPQQIFGWRRQLQASQTALSPAEEPQFVPAVLDVAPSSRSVCRQRKMPRCPVEPGAGMIEVEIDGVRVRVGRGVDAKTVTAVLRALKDGT
jgi:transposase